MRMAATLQGSYRGIQKKVEKSYNLGISANFGQINAFQVALRAARSHGGTAG
jgi:hypothetical protein